MYKNITLKKIKFTNNAVYNTLEMLRSGKCTSVYWVTGKGSFNYKHCRLHKNSGKIKKYSIIKITPEKSVAYFLHPAIHCFTEITAQRQLGMWTKTSTEQTKGKSQRYTSLNTCWVTTTKQQRSRTMHAGMSASEKNPPTKMGRHKVRTSVRFIHTQHRGGQMLGQH